MTLPQYLSLRNRLYLLSVKKKREKEVKILTARTDSAILAASLSGKDIDPEIAKTIRMAFKQVRDKLK